MTERDYELLSEIAPTVTSVAGSLPYFSPWQDQVLQVARALGPRGRRPGARRPGRGRLRRRSPRFHPEWAGLTATFSQGAPYDGQLYVYPDGLSTDFLTDLGFEITPGSRSTPPTPASRP